MKKLIFIYIILFFGSFSLAQENFKIDSEIRLRSHIDDKDFSSDTKLQSFHELRTSLGVNLFSEDDISGYLQFRDSRILGNEISTIANSANIDLHQGFIKIDNLFELPMDVKAGRMELNLANQRLFGAVDWSNIGRSFDGALLVLKGNKFDTKLFAFQENEYELFGDSLDQFIYGGHANYFGIENYSIEPFIYYQKNNSAESLSRISLGFYVKGNLSYLTHETELVYQTGNYKSGSNDIDIAAFMAAFNIKYHFQGKTKPYFYAGIDYLSGDNNFTDNKNSTFNTLYGTNHKFYGFMDYFINIPTSTYNAGLFDTHIGGGLNLNEKLKIDIKIHLFKSSSELTLISGKESNDFGIESDFTAVYKYSKKFTIQGGISFFAPGEIFKETKGEDSSLWIYLMNTVNF